MVEKYNYSSMVTIKARPLHVTWLLHWALSLAVQCIVIGPVCGGVFVSVFVAVCVCARARVCLWVCYHDNSKLRASILTKLGSDHLQLIKSWPSCDPGKGCAVGRNLGPPNNFSTKRTGNDDIGHKPYRQQHAPYRPHTMSISATS